MRTIPAFVPVLTLLAATLATAAAGAADAAEPGPRFTAAGLTEHIKVLASDEFEGRRSATPGGEKTVAYLEQAFRDIGLKPGAGDSYRQSVPFVELATDPSPALELSGPEEGKLSFAYGPEAVYWTTRVSPQTRLEDSELVFVGYGIVDPSRQWNDYAGLDMRGKTAVILVNDPGFATADPELFKGRTMTYFGRWTYKFDEAARQGASGAIIVHEDEPAAYPWAVVQNGAAKPQLVLDTADGNAWRAELEGWVTLDAVRRMFAAAGMDYEAMKARAAKPGFRAVPMGLRASAEVRNTIRRATSSNVIGLLEGSRRPDEYLVVAAHWDHLGRNESIDGDGIFNGAVDNATGTAGMLELARAFVELRPRPERSMLFIGFTGEEDGLLGSEYFADHPTVPVTRIVGGLNIDGMIVYGRTRDVTVVGFGSSELEDYLHEAAARQGRVLQPEPTPEKGFYFRSDHFPLAGKGVPMLYAKGGVDSVEHGREWALAWQKDFIATRYHKPSDEFDPDWDLSGAIEDLDMYFDVLQRLGNDTRFPEWRPGNEFRSIREQSFRTVTDGR